MRSLCRGAFDDADAIALSDPASAIKPGLAPLLIFAVLLWVSTSLTYLGIQGQTSTVLSRAFLLSVFSVLGASIICVVKPASFVPFLLSALLFGALLGIFGAFEVTVGLETLSGDISFTDAEVVADSKQYERSCSTTIKLDASYPFSFLIKLTTASDESFLAGEHLSGRVAIKASKDTNAERRWSEGISADARAIDLATCNTHTITAPFTDLRRNAIAQFNAQGNDTSALMAALACGYRQGIEKRNIYEEFKTAGLAHVVAVSGAHLSIVSALMAALLRFVRTPKRISLAIIASFLLAYLVFAGLPISGVRSACMALASSAAFFTKRRAASMNALALMVIAFLICDPKSCLSVSMFLSAASTLGIICFAGLFLSWIPLQSRLLRSLIGDPLALTFSSQVMCQGASCALFSLVPLIAPLANIVVAPLFMFACASSLLCAIAANAPVVPFAFMTDIGGMPVFFMRMIVGALAKVPHASVAVSVDFIPMIVLSLAVSLLLWLVWPQPSKRLAITALVGAILVVFGIFWIVPAGVGEGMVMLDVGQGDAFLLRSEGMSILIDTGNQDAKLRRALAHERITHLDAVIITHPDDDHCGSLRDLASYVTVSHIYVAEDLLACSCDSCARLRSEAGQTFPSVCLTGLSVADEVQAGRYSLAVLWPDAFADEGGNADSLCLYASYDGDDDGQADFTCLFTGDAEAEELSRMAALGRIESVDILKVGHHGSKASLDDGLVSTLDPRIALISVGEGNRYGHPAYEIIEILETHDVEVFRTDESGCVEIRYHDGSITVDQRARS